MEGLNRDSFMTTTSHLPVACWAQCSDQRSDRQESGEMKGFHALALLLSASFITFSWSVPQAHFQRRNWTPQAMLYLKGAQGRRFISEESQRKDLYDRLQLETRSQNGNPLTLSEAAALFLSSLRKAAQEEDEEETEEKPGYVADGLVNW